MEQKCDYSTHKKSLGLSYAKVIFESLHLYDALLCVLPSDLVGCFGYFRANEAKLTKWSSQTDRLCGPPSSTAQLGSLLIRDDYQWRIGFTADVKYKKGIQQLRYRTLKCRLSKENRGASNTRKNNTAPTILCLQA